MILAVLPLIPLIPLAWGAGVAAAVGLAGWVKGRSNKKKLKKEIAELKKYKKEIEKQFKTVAERQQRHEDDLNGIIVNLETGQTAEQVEFGIFPKSVNETVEYDNYVGDDRFEILDL